MLEEYITNGRFGDGTYISEWGSMFKGRTKRGVGYSSGGTFGEASISYRL